jgi:hypothetical protein
MGQDMLKYPWPRRAYNQHSPALPRRRLLACANKGCNFAGYRVVFSKKHHNFA